jgi:hypothetical protein
VSVRKLYALKLRGGPEVRAVLYFDHEEGEATVEISVSACQAEDVVAERLASALKAALDRQGATPLTEVAGG